MDKLATVVKELVLETGEQNSKALFIKRLQMFLMFDLVILHGICLSKMFLNMEKMFGPKICIATLSI